MTRPCTFTIRYHPPERGGPGYFGASVSFPPLPGEDWERGNDLADGEANSETLGRILRDVEAVVAGFRNAYEMDNPA